MNGRLSGLLGLTESNRAVLTDCGARSPKRGSELVREALITFELLGPIPGATASTARRAEYAEGYGTAMATLTMALGAVERDERDRR